MSMGSGGTDDAAGGRVDEYGQADTADAASHAVKVVPKKKNASLLIVNHRGFLTTMFQEEASRVSAWIETEVMTLCAGAVAAEKGIVDAFSADHVNPVFGTGAKTTS